MARQYLWDVVEQTAIAGALNPELLTDPERAPPVAEYIAGRLNFYSAEYERGWAGEPTEDGGLRFEREVRGVKEVHVIDGPLIRSAEARKLDAQAPKLQQIYERQAEFTRKEDTFPINSPSSLLETVLSLGRKGLSIQRYKGLGEMNPDQLWETTLDSNSRTLLQVKVEQADEANDLFDELMGDAVGPRREFIEQNALKVANLDI